MTLFYGDSLRYIIPLLRGYLPHPPSLTVADSQRPTAHNFNTHIDLGSHFAVKQSAVSRPIRDSDNQSAQMRVKDLKMYLQKHQHLIS